MKKFVSIQQANITTNEVHVLYEGICEYVQDDNQMSLHYIEHESEIAVKVVATHQGLSIQREGELKSDLVFVAHKTTKNTIGSPYGIVSVDLYTHEYLLDKGHVLVDYDVLSNNEVTDSFQIEFIIEEVQA
ncbi:MAG: DUF1934 family protein [Erysipelotrichaceae bacterium]